MKDYQIQTIAGVQIGSGYTNAMGEFTLEADQKAVFKDIPVGVDYKVEELLPEDSPYELLKATGTEGATLQAGVTADFTNAIGGFAVAKTVVGEYGQTPPEDDDFTFEVTCDGALLADHPYRLYGVFGEEIRDQEYRTSSAGEFSLKAGQRALFTGFARNTQYQIREKAKLFYTQTIPAKGAAWNGVIGDTVETLLFENQYSKNAALAIRKEVEDPGALGVSESDAFTFRLKVDGRPYAGKVYTLNDSTEPYRTMEDGTFQIRNGDTAHFDDLLDEARCVIEEIAMPDGYEEVETGPVEILVTSGAEHVFVKKNRKVPTIWVENTTGDDTEDNSDDNRGGTVLVLDDSGQEVTGSRHKVNSGSDDGTENRMNTKGRYTQKAVAGEPEEGWQVDTEQVTIGLKGMDGISGAHQQISGLPQTEAPGADGDYYSPDTGQFRYTQALPDGTSRTLTGEITEDRSTGMVKISFDPMDYDVDVGIPFKKRSYTMPKTGGTGTLPCGHAGFQRTAQPAARRTRRRGRKRRPETEEPV